MSALSILTKITLPTSLLFLSSCQVSDLAQNPLVSLRNSAEHMLNEANAEATNTRLSNVLSVKDVVAQASPKINVDAGFVAAVTAGVNSDPKVKISKSEILQQQARLGITKSRLDFQFSGTVYAGIEDVTDDTKGIAGVLSASKVMYDGGQISNTVSADEYVLQSALEGYRAALDKSAFEISGAWVELERYQGLNTLILGRLAVLDPLINQLEQIADAGVGDATKVAAAQRTVAMIRVTQTDIEENLAQAELKFTQLLGKLPMKTTFDAALVAKAVPRRVTDEMIMAAPGLLSIYFSYLASLQTLEASKARNSVVVGFETKVQRPFGQSGYDSDESIGFVVRKTLYDGDKLASEILAAQATVYRQEESIRDNYRRVKKGVDAATQSILAMDKAI